MIARDDAAAAQAVLVPFASTAFGYYRAALSSRLRVGRYLSALVTLAGGDRVFVKWNPAPGGGLLAREAAFLTNLELCPEVAPLIPRLLAFSAGEGILATAGCTGYVPLDRRLRSKSLIDVAPAIAAAMALAAVHRQPPDGKRVAFPIATPDSLTPEQLVQQPADYFRLAQVLQACRSAIESLHARWRPSHLIHGDFKASNLLLRVDGRIKHQPFLKIVDWELAGAGDPLWDVGSYTGSLLLAWVDYLGEIPSGSPADALRRQIGYFLVAYRQQMPEVARQAGCFVPDVLQYAGIFLLHRVMVGLGISGRLDPACSLMLDLAAGLLNHPERAAAALVPGLQ